MSKARPHAHIYEKWVRGIRQAVPDERERCVLYEYIIAYQIAKVYGAAAEPNRRELSKAAAVALAMLEGDLEELCEARKDNNERRRENGAQNVPASTEQTLAGASRTLQSNTKQSNTIQSNTIQSNSKAIAMQAIDSLAEPSITIFDMGLALLRKGYFVRYDLLQSVYERARKAKSPLSYAEKSGFTKLAGEPTAGAICANYIEATKCKDARALEMYGAKLEGSTLVVRCTPQADDAIGKAGTENAMQYAAQIGASEIKHLCNGR